jgi:hypothetical protein
MYFTFSFDTSSYCLTHLGNEVTSLMLPLKVVVYNGKVVFSLNSKQTLICFSFLLPRRIII